MKSVLILASCVAFFVSLTADCLDLTLNDGTVYKNATVLTKTIDGIDIESAKDYDITILKHIMYRDLSPESLKLFPEYDKAKAEEYIKSIHSKAQAGIARNAERQAEWTRQAAAQANSPLFYPAVTEIPGAWLVLKATKELEHGTVGWASTEDAAEGPSTQGHFGKIYVYGLKITAGNEWAGKLYLTNKTMQDGNEGFLCYTTSQSLADSLNKREK